MDWKKKMEEMKATADGAIKKAEAKLDKDGDGVPDVVEATVAKAKAAAEAAKAKLAEMKANMDKDGDGTPDMLENMTEQGRHAFEQAKAKAAELAKAAQEKLGKRGGTKPPENA